MNQFLSLNLPWVYQIRSISIDKLNEKSSYTHGRQHWVGRVGICHPGNNLGGHCSPWISLFEDILCEDCQPWILGKNSTV